MGRRTDRLRDNRNYTWTRVENGLFDPERYAALDPHALKVYLYLTFRAGNKDVAWPTYTTICRDCGLARATVASAVESLRRTGLITTEEHGRSQDYLIEPIPATSSGDEPVQEMNQFTARTSSPDEPVQEMNRYGSGDELVQQMNSELDTISGVSTRLSEQEPAPVVTPVGRSDGGEPAVSADAARALPTPAKRARTPRPPTPMETAVYAAWGVDPAAGGVTKAFAIEVSAVAGQLASAGADHAQVAGKKAAYERDHPRWDCTPRAVAKHWPLLRAEPERTSIYDSTAYVPVTTYRNPFAQMIRREDYIWDTDEDQVRVPGN